MADNARSHRREFLRMAASGAASAVALGALTHPSSAAENAVRPDLEMLSFDVRRFGAKGDGVTIDSPAINNAIAAAAEAGGATVLFPAGTYASYSIHLKSNVCLYLDSGATILAAPTPLEGTNTGGYDAAATQGPWE